MSGKLITTRLELKNYIRMDLGKFSRFVYTPDAGIPLQIILGTNGSGKSSLQYELWPLPGDSNYFTTGGLKDHTLEYNGHTYRIISDYSVSAKGFYSFYVDDGPNLNEGGKIELCRSLCFEHFGVNNEIRSLALGMEPLTSMGPARRRYWMVKLADSDFTYAMKAYGKLRDEHRDATGTVKRLQKRLVDENAKLVDKEVADGISSEIAEIKALIKEIYGQRNATITPSAEIRDKLQGLEAEIEQMCVSADRIDLSVLATSGCETREELIEKIQEETLLERECQGLQQHVFSEHLKVRKKFDLMCKAGTESITELGNKLVELEVNVAKLKGELTWASVEFSGRAADLLAVYGEIYNDLFEQIGQLPSNDTGYFSSEKREALKEENQLMHQESMRLEQSIARIAADLDHRESHLIPGVMTCPKCNHSWTLKASDEDVQRVKDEVTKMKVRLSELDEKRKKNDEYLAEFADFDARYRSIMLIINNHRMLSPYLNIVCLGGRLMKFPSAVATDLYSIRRDLEVHVEIDAHTEKIAKIREQIELKQSMDAQSIEEIEKQMEELSEKMSVYNTRLGFIRATIQDLNTILRTYDNVEARRKKMLEAHDMSQTLSKQYAYSRYQELLSYAIMGLQTQLARKEDALSTITHQQQIVEDIKLQISIQAMQERVAKAAHIALSPTNGAIAEGLRRFNNIYVNRMNKVIGAIWSYPLEILSTEMEDGQIEMDYKFPFRKNGKGRPFNDVSEGSESMLDIFDFAFRICAIRQLKLTHLPLFLDEFESAFDVTHRETAIYFIKRLLEEDHYGQVFMVSHFESNHGALSNLGQTCVLNDQNVMLSTNIEINKNVTFE